MLGLEIRSENDSSSESSTETDEYGTTWRTLPSALSLDKSKKRLVVFLDYDGTLTPIVSDPSAATLSTTMREAVRRLAARAPVAVVSGRAREKIHEFVDLSEIFYAGSHGFDIDGPNGLRHAVKADVLPLLGDTFVALNEKLSGIDGVTVEDNRFALSVHWRNVATNDRDKIEQIVDEVLASPPYQGHLRKSKGKCVYELRPKVDWDKGKAVVYLLELLRRRDETTGKKRLRRHHPGSSPPETTETETTTPEEGGILPQQQDNDEAPPKETSQPPVPPESGAQTSAEKVPPPGPSEKQEDDPSAKDAWYDSILPVYIGDDMTDEDAFGALKPLGGICVLNVTENDESQRPHLTKATHVLRGVHDVETFLNFLADL